ncbi:MAG: NUDIX hydrolase [Steroidobacteraceae bacterium]
MPTLDLARKLLALAQSGLHFTRDPYDKERYEEIARIASELLAAQSAAPDVTPGGILELWRKDRGYVTPKIEVRGAIFRERASKSEVLLVRETIDGKWTLPGGWVDVNEGPRQAIEKEIVQESGYVAEVVKLAAVYDKLRHAHPPSLFHTWKLFFLCEIRGGQPTLSLETDGIEFFALDSLPELSMPRTTPAQIARMHVHYLNRDLPTDVD